LAQELLVAMRTAARVFAAIQHFKGLTHPFPRVGSFSRRLWNVRSADMDRSRSGTPVDLYGTCVVAAMGLGGVGLASVPPFLLTAQAEARAAPR